MNNLIKYFLVLLIIAGLSSGCENFLTPSMDQQKTTETAVNNLANLESVVKGAHEQLIQGGIYGRDFIVSPEVMADNAYSNANSGRFVTQDNVDYTVNSGYPTGVWDSFYEVIAATNFTLKASKNLDPSSEVDHIKGQAYAIRALAHMNLLLSFGQQYVSGGDKSKGVPYVTAYAEGNTYPPRNATSEVWTKIGEDLQQAVGLMDKSKFDPTLMNYWAARALQTRYYLYTEEYEKVKTVAEEIINSANFSIIDASSYISKWSSSVPGSLLELAFTSSSRLGINSIGYVYLNTEYGDISVTDDLYNSYSSGDIRLNLYSLDDTEAAPFYRMTGKFVYPQGEDNIPVIRYAEVILNYAEALAQNPATQPQALAQLNKITSNRNAPAYSAGTIENVLQERRLELAMEGHRLFDLVRTERDIPVGDSDSYRGSVIPYGDYRLALPIPNVEIQANSNIEQNKGYK